VIHNTILLSFHQIITKASQQKFVVGNDKEESRATTQVVWRRLETNFIKVNFDASVKKPNGIGMGLVARDHNGMVLGAMTFLINTVFEPQIAKALCYR